MGCQCIFQAQFFWLVLSFFLFLKPHFFHQLYNIIWNSSGLSKSCRCNILFSSQLCCLLDSCFSCCFCFLGRLPCRFFLSRLSCRLFFRRFSCCLFLSRFSCRLFFRRFSCRFFLSCLSCCLCFRCLSLYLQTFLFSSSLSFFSFLLDSFNIFLFLLLDCFRILLLLCFPLLKDIFNSHLSGYPKRFILFFHRLLFNIQASSACKRHAICQSLLKCRAFYNLCNRGLFHRIFLFRLFFVHLF